MGGGKGDPTYGCNLKILFLVTLKCGKSKSLSLGASVGTQAGERGKFRCAGGILSLSAKGEGGRGGLRGERRLVVIWECLFILD